MKRKSLVAPKTLNTKALLKQLGPETETRIDLTEKKIGNEGLVWLASEVLPKRKNVKELELFGNDINDDGVDILVDILKKNYKINTVKLQFNNITAAGAETLAGHLRIDEALVRLDLYGNKIGDAGCEHLAKALGRNTSLTSLGLFGCKIGNKGATCLVRNLENNKTIKVVNVDNNDIEDDLVEAITAYCARNNGEEYEVPASIYTFLQQYPEEDKRKSLKPGAPVVAPLAAASVSPVTPSESPRPSSASASTASQPLPMPAVSNITEKLVNSFARSSTESEYSGERKEMIEKMTTLVKDKEALTAHIAQLRQEIEKLQQKNNQLEQFVFTIKRGFSALEREYPLPE